MKSRVGEAARDPAGFDREKCHPELNREVLSFLQSAFADGHSQTMSALSPEDGK
jgi:hypothetical protein